MTRHEAKMILQVSGFDEYSADLWLGRFVSLGMLKLDELKNPEMRAGEIINAYVDGTETAAILMELSDAGLKIVEK